MLVRTLTLCVCLLVVCVQGLLSQTTSPAPTEAGYPFFTAYGCCQSKMIRGEDRNAWFNAAGRIGRMNINGTQKYFVVNQNGSWPLGVTYGPDNKVWFTLFEGKVGRLNPSTGGVTYWPLPPNSHARDITPGSDGALWFPTGPHTGRITTSGVITFFPSPFGASALRTARDGSLWMIDTFGRKIARMTTLGRVTNVWELSSGASSCGACASISAGPDGNMWFTLNENIATVGRITPSGTITYFQLPGEGAASITWGRDGAMWFTDIPGKHVGRITTQGALKYFDTVGQGRDSAPNAIVSGPDGNIWFTGSREFDSGIGKVVLNLPRNRQGRSFSAEKGTAASRTVASFDDVELVTPSNFQAYIHWGDGTTSKGQVKMTSSGNPRRFTVVGTHTYKALGSYRLTINIIEAGNQYRFSVASRATVTQ